MRTKLTFAPGVNKDDTPLATEGGWIDADKVRFVNGQPQTLGGWETVVGSTFTGIARGAHAWTRSTGDPYLAWGTATKLYVLEGGTIKDITPAGLPAGLVDGVGGTGYGTNAYSAGTYGTSAGTGRYPRVWSLVNWGDTLLASPSGGALYAWAPGAAAATVVATAPDTIDSMFLDANKILVAVGTKDAGGTYNAMLVRWSDQEDYTNWTAASTNLSGDYPLADGSRAVAGIATRQQNLILTDTAAYTMQFTGDAGLVFSFRQVGTGCGVVGAMALEEHNGAVFWWSKENFYVFQGSAPQIIPCNLRRDVMGNVALYQPGKIYCSLNPAYSEVIWFYPDGRDSSGTNKECTRYVVYNFADGHFTPGTFGRSSWVPAGVFDYPIGFGTDSYLYYHEKGFSANGGVLTAYLESAYADIEDGQNFVSIQSIIPDFDDQQGPVDFYISTKRDPNGSETSSGPYQAGPATTRLWLRRTGRHAKIKLSSSATPSFWRLGALSLDIRKSGARR